MVSDRSPSKLKKSAQQEKGFILDRCIVYLGLTVPNLQKKRLLIFEIFNIKKRTLFLEPSIVWNAEAETTVCYEMIYKLIQAPTFRYDLLHSIY